jgi:hypothetical protein
MKLIHTYLTILAGIFSTTLYAQASTNEAPAPALADNTVTQQAVTVDIEQPASSNETVTTAMETSGNGEVASSSLSPTGIPFDNSPYPIILEKMPFGVPPNPDDLNAAATSMDEAKLKVEQEKAAAAFSWTAINITPTGKTAIGFTDLSAKPPASYYLTVGESANEWTVLDADYANETATIEKVVDANKIRISLKFGNKSPIAPSTPGAPPISPPPLGIPAITMAGHNHGRQPEVPQPMIETHALSLPASGGTPTTLTSTTSASHSSLLTSYRDRLNERLKTQENQKQETDRKQKEELSKIVTDALRKQQEEAAAVAAQQPQGEGQPVPPVEVPVQ